MHNMQKASTAEGTRRVGAGTEASQRKCRQVLGKVVQACHTWDRWGGVYRKSAGRQQQSCTENKRMGLGVGKRQGRVGWVGAGGVVVVVAEMPGRWWVAGKYVPQHVPIQKCKWGVVGKPAGKAGRYGGMKWGKGREGREGNGNGGGGGMARGHMHGGHKGEVPTCAGGVGVGEGQTQAEQPTPEPLFS